MNNLLHKRFKGVIPLRIKLFLVVLCTFFSYSFTVLYIDSSIEALEMVQPIPPFKRDRWGINNEVLSAYIEPDPVYNEPFIGYVMGLGLGPVLEHWLVDLAWCESRYDVKAMNTQEVIINGVSYGHASGLFQYLPDTWKRNCTGDIWNWKDQVDCTIEKYNAGQQHEWMCNNIIK